MRYNILRQKSDICSVLVIVNNGFSICPKLEFLFCYFCLSHFAPIILKSETLQDKIVLPRRHEND